MPAMSTVMLWNLDDVDGFSEQYARARRMQAELMIDEMLEIADGLRSNDVQRDRLAVDTRKWYASKEGCR